MKKILCFFFILSVSFVFSQNEEEQLASDYFKNGEFEKALITYQKLYETNPNNYNYIFQLIKTQQQLRHLDDAEQLIKNKLSQYNNPALIVELGYNYQLKDSIDLANSYYDEAVSKIKEKPIFV